jgi:O-antigen/teichoic acid export membrane protein
MTLEVSADTLQKHAWRGWVWNGIEQFAQRGLAMVVSLVLARMLDPESFGLIASVSIFLTMAQQLIDGGIGSRIVQKKSIMEEDYLALFWCNAAMSILTCGALIIFSSQISIFYNNFRLQPVVMAMALVIFLMNAGRVQDCQLIREMRFRTISLITIGSVVTGSIIGLIIAFLGGGVWAILGQQLTISLVRAGSFWVLVPWKPTGLPPWSAVKDLYGFGLPIMVSQTIRGLSEQLVNVLTARHVGMTALGYYDRGRFIPGQVVLFSRSIFSRTNFSVLSKLQHDDVEFRKAFIDLMGVLATVCMLSMTGLAVCASDIVEIVLGAKWIPAVWFFQTSCIFSPLYLIFLTNQEVLKAKGAVSALSRLNFIYAGLQVIFVFSGLHWGGRGMVVGSIIGCLLTYMASTIIVSRIGRIAIFSQLTIFIRPLAWSLTTGAVLWSVRQIGLGLVYRFSICAILGAVAFVAANWKLVKSSQARG